MKKATKTLAMALLASTTANALDKPIFVSSIELKIYEERANLIGIERKMLESGLLVKTSKKEIYILNEIALSKNSDESLLTIISNLVEWLTEGEVSVEPKDWKNMTPSTQDYKI